MADSEKAIDRAHSARYAATGDRSVKKLVTLLVVVMLAGCASPGSSVESSGSAGHFLFAGPMSAEAPELSARWAYIFQFTVDPASITQVAFTCEPLPGTTITIKGNALRIDATGKGRWVGELLPVSQDTTPWMLDMSQTTSATCQAVVSRADMPDAIERAQVNFTPAAKAATLQQLKTAQQYNSKLPKK